MFKSTGWSFGCNPDYKETPCHFYKMFKIWKKESKNIRYYVQIQYFVELHEGLWVFWILAQVMAAAHWLGYFEEINNISRWHSLFTYKLVFLSCTLFLTGLTSFVEFALWTRLKGMLCKDTWHEAFDLYPLNEPKTTHPCREKNISQHFCCISNAAECHHCRA